MKVIKRDGRKVEFNKDKIIKAILSAFEEVDGELTSDAKFKTLEIVSRVEKNIEESKSTISVEEIQDIIEE